MIVVGARRSPLAVVQAEQIAEQLRDLGHEVTIVGITSEGDTDRRPLTEIGGTGVFAAAVRARLLDGSIDVAVHSLKDLPVAGHPGLVVGATPTRDAGNDVLVGLPIEQWSDESVIGTGSPRRQAQLKALAAERGVTPTFVSVRGNVDTRLGLVADGKVDATVLARAGLARLGKVPAEDTLPAVLNHRAPTDQGLVHGGPVDQSAAEQSRAATPITLTLLSFEQMLPAPGQGALAVECREGDALVREAVAGLDHAPTQAAVTAERAFLARLEAGCLAPVGAWASVDEHDQLDLRVAVARPDGGLVRLRHQAPVANAAAVGQDLAEQVLEQLGTDSLSGDEPGGDRLSNPHDARQSTSGVSS